MQAICKAGATDVEARERARARRDKSDHYRQSAPALNMHDYASWVRAQEPSELTEERKYAPTMQGLRICRSNTEPFDRHYTAIVTSEGLALVHSQEYP